MKKGFTLIELLGVLIVLALIALIVTPGIISIVNNSKNSAYDVQISIIEEAAKKYAVENSALLPKQDSNKKKYISLGDLIQSGSLNNSDIINPKTGEVLEGYVEVSYDNNYNQYIYSYVETIDPNAVFLTGPVYNVSNLSNWTTSKNVIITYPEGYDSYEYKILDGIVTIGDITIEGDSNNNWIATNSLTQPITFHSNGSLITRIQDGTDYIMGETLSITNIDTTKPSSTLAYNSATITNNSINLTATCADNQSGIIKYEFRLNTGNWIDNGIVNTYLFKEITNTSDNVFYSRCTNGSGLISVSYISPQEEEIQPVFTVENAGVWKQNKNVTIAFPDSYNKYEYMVLSGTATINEEAILNETWKTITSNSLVLNFTTSGSIAARATASGTVSLITQNITKVDSIKPEITVSTTNIWDTTETITITGTDNELEALKYALTTSSTITSTDEAWQDSNQFILDSNNTWYAWAMDSAKNISLSKTITNSHVCLGIWDLSVSTDGSIYGILKLDGTLSITGSGNTKSFSDTTSRPFNSLSSRVINIAIEEGITGLGARIFQSMSTVKTISISSTLQTINLNTFEATTAYNADGITIASGNTSFKFENSTLFDYNKTTIYTHSKNDATSVYTIPSTVTYISHAAFQSNSNITTLNISSLFNIGWNAFNSCTNLTTINSTVGNTTINGVIGNTAISPNTFYNTKLTNAKISKSVTSFSKSGTTYFPFVTNAGTIYYYGSNAAVTEYLANKPALDIATYKAIATVSFDSNGGSSVSSIEAVYGETYGTLSTPTKTGSTFDGWYTELSGGTKVESTTNTIQSTDHILYAHWQ